MSNNALKQTIIQYANQCVRCGLCVSHCPTYRVTHNESESPRGRIHIIKALASEEIKLTKTTKLHLDHCLTCRACEAVCPVGVKYGQLIDHAKTMINPPGKRVSRFLDFSLKHPRFMRLGFKLLRFYQITGIQWLLRKTHVLNLLKLNETENFLQPIAKIKPFKKYYPPHHKTKANVALFTGCIGQYFDYEILMATIQLLNKLNIGVYVPKQQTCCGAIHLHSGEHNTAAAFLKQNKRGFSALNITTITTSTGCQVVLQENGLAVLDICDYLKTLPWLDTVKFKSLPKKILLHTPCTLHNVIKSQNSVKDLLTRIPQLKVFEATNPFCCGAAGTYMLEHIALSKRLNQHLLDDINHLKPDYVITSNVGCKLQLNTQIKRTKQPVHTTHPVIFLNKQLF